MSKIDWTRCRKFVGEPAFPKEEPKLDGKRVWRGYPPKAPLRGDERAKAVEAFLRRAT